jgi:hypothetical protein
MGNFSSCKSVPGGCSVQRLRHLCLKGDKRVLQQQLQLHMYEPSTAAASIVRVVASSSAGCMLQQLCGRQRFAAAESAGQRKMTAAAAVGAK